MMRLRRSRASASRSSTARRTLPSAAAAAAMTPASPGSRPMAAAAARATSPAASGRKAKHTATGADGRQNPRRGVTHQQQQRLPRRLFQDLEQRIRTVRVQFIHRIDDRDPPSSLCRCRAEKSDAAAHVIDLDFLAELPRFFIDACARSPADLDALAPRCGEQWDASHRHRKRCRVSAPPAHSGSGCARTNRAIRYASVALPIPADPAEQPAMRQAAAAVGSPAARSPQQHDRRVPMSRAAAADRHARRLSAPSLMKRSERSEPERRRERGARSPPSRCARRRGAWARSHRSVSSAPARKPPADDSLPAAPDGLPAILPRTDPELPPRAVCCARASPISAGTSMMNVRSGLRSPTVTLSSARMNFGSTWPRIP